MQKLVTPESIHETADVVVIGGGIIGVATAFWLSKAGLSTVVVEMRDGLSTLTTTASVESYRAQFVEPAMAALALESIKVWENFAEATGLEGYSIDLHQGGYLFVTEDEAKISAIEEAVKGYHAVGVTDAEVLSGEEIVKRNPWLSPTICAGTFRQKDGWFSAHEATLGFARAAANAKFYIRTRAVGIKTDAKGVCGVVTDRGEIATRTVVNAAGPFAITVAKWVGIDLPIYQMRRQRVFVAPNPLIPAEAPFTVDIDNESYWRPETGGALLGWHDPDEPKTEPLEEPSGDWDFPAINLEMVAQKAPFWHEVAENLTQEDISVYAGQYVHSPDDQPILGPVPEVPGLYLNCAYWPGVMLSPAAGRWVTDMILGKMDPAENPLRLSRFKEGVTATQGALLRGRH